MATRTYKDTGALVGGVSPVLEVPFHDDGALDPDGFTTVVERVLATGVSSMMFPGFASEFHKLDGERDLLTSLFLERTRERDDVAAIVSVTDHATRHAIARARRAADLGADALNLLPPHFLGPSRDAVLTHLRAVLAAVDPLPVVVQYAPAQTGTALDAPTLHRLAAEHPHLRWVKVEAAPPGRLIAALAAGERPLPSLVGYAGLHLPDALRRGAVGVQPGCSFTELYVECWRRWQHGDEAGAVDLHTRLLPYLSYWMQHVELIVAVEKEISVRRGWFASAHCRAPGHRLDEEELRMIDRFCAEFAPLIPELAQ
ncbi:dihydrodipicolinate synthase family protein [Streptomyces sp. TM32]|uniref:dihydrodipicolinate synthase family protein n=1 Tax=Streptomyces sp. TM32 TaxID=1652669 RepID=UPI001013B386|nr:dihydrodipicolinate synthase family protein [Streptomyces sp. TM32]RXS84885.1 dihydrodipicolinate synthase family protein [Streptomyces sp. TM32]